MEVKKKKKDNAIRRSMRCVEKVEQQRKMKVSNFAMPEINEVERRGLRESNS